MSLYLSVDVDLLERGLRKLPPLPGLLLHLAWGATMLRNSSALRSFATMGLFKFQEKKRDEAPVYDLAS